MHYGFNLIFLVMRKNVKTGLLSKCRTEIIPLEHSLEGKLRGGFGGVSVNAIPAINDQCLNDGCSNSGCINFSCINKNGCSNTGCSSGTLPPTSTPSTSPTYMT